MAQVGSEESRLPSSLLPRTAQRAYPADNAADATVAAPTASPSGMLSGTG